MFADGVTFEHYLLVALVAFLTAILGGVAGYGTGLLLRRSTSLIRIVAFSSGNRPKAVNVAAAVSAIQSRNSCARATPISGSSRRCSTRSPLRRASSSILSFAAAAVSAHRTGAAPPASNNPARSDFQCDAVRDGPDMRNQPIRVGAYCAAVAVKRGFLSLRHRVAGRMPPWMFRIC